MTGLDPTNSVPARSTFVTVVAWIFLVLSGFTAFVGVLQNIMIWFLFPREQIHDAVNAPEVAKNTPPFVSFLFGHIEFFFLAFFLLALITLLSSVGLLRRREWARKTFVAIMGLGVLWNIGTAVMQRVMIGSDEAFKAGPREPPEFQNMMIVMQVFMWVFALGLSALFVWIIVRLMSPAVRAEFTPHDM